MSIAGMLLPMALDMGLPLVSKILEGKIGAGNAALVEGVVRSVADKAGVTPESLPEVIAASPDTIATALGAAEVMAPELIALYAQGLEHQTAIMKMEQAEPWWAWAWRPGMMYVFAFLWLWNLVILHVFNAWLKIALPPSDLWLLFQLNALYMTLYMGGHTLKDAMTKFAAGRSGAR
ncbi:hypothetical protein [Pelagibacterium halotolerans]|uniref:Uncharacterized protein n=1 Tax=Pelagibacterium halotolerans (strain DSM 22347 / JCM 15775 / CGMCC 1.7692 / B2) TaxID=1082931 RepID=G4RDE2_PELHB|nr:hypothetical protein [Pelagibacterium halotolerans]AEQ50768.1 hypothetical protein KKY_729 [Pelagibacterium halotolerans B2]QJR19314.1 hypothetical protein HKM20_13215 [Pelagibacterium halotolerans]SDZ95322.1 hypothetical protein SAMN05428936_101655 [Pelagibacterium halotolerans]